MSKTDTVARFSLIFARKVHFLENSSVRVNFCQMRAAAPIPAVAAASVLHSAAVGGSVVGVVGPPYTFGELNSCELGVFRF